MSEGERHSIAAQPSLITDPIEEATRESENAVAQFDRVDICIPPKLQSPLRLCVNPSTPKRAPMQEGWTHAKARRRGFPSLFRSRFGLDFDAPSNTSARSAYLRALCVNPTCHTLPREQDGSLFAGRTKRFNHVQAAKRLFSRRRDWPPLPALPRLGGGKHM
jgi:hypothetical protein